ncbi:hypothetical protein B0A55_08223 [Friedmanniomyces simplex]|uniref:DUF2470 domain-containing protein n=1 Tax=Friedmanniomyces simplex TaxID=329884 RepID=A0A4V5NF86_9PEZI|nr:hypothetical protein B0A55_08223 [Friedmanniomyces simplex]
MAKDEAKDNATKTRIITHMNQDHHESLIRYLEHYAKLSPWQAHDARLTALDLQSMTLTTNNGAQTHRIPLNPPMTSYREARERAVAMDQEALQGLRRSEITITEFLPPTGIYAIVFAAISAVFLAYSQRSWFDQGQIVSQILGPGFARFSYKVQPAVISFMLFMHTAETLYFMRYRLIRHSVNPRTRLFWLWASTTFVEGAASFWRFNGLVRAKREAKAKQQH